MLLELLAQKLVLNPDYIEIVASTASRRYFHFQIDKRGGMYKRNIWHPSKELKALQRVIHDEVLSKLPIHEAATAYRKGSKIRNHASLHLNARYILRLDFKDFFESIKKNEVLAFASDKFPAVTSGWTKQDSELFSDLVCFNKTLTIGSPTSPLLTNAMCYELDSRIVGVCAADNIKYTRYADDMYFSCSEPNILYGLPAKVKRIVRSLNSPTTLWINYDKTIHTSKKHKMCVTGLTLTVDGKVSIGRSQKRHIRSMIHNWNSLQTKEKQYLSGYLAYCSSVEPNFVNILCEKYGAKVISEIQAF